MLPLLMPAVPAQAPSLPLTRAEVLDKLTPVPVFIIADAKGGVVLGKGADGRQKLTIFLRKADADASFARVKAGNPDLASKVKVSASSMKTVMSVVWSTDDMDAYFVPSTAEQKKAVSTLQAQQTRVKSANWVPLYALKMIGESGYLSVSEEGKSGVPIFFDMAMAEEVKTKAEAGGGMKGKLKIEVITLERFLELLLTSSSDKTKELELIPSKVAVADAKTLSGGS